MAPLATGLSPPLLAGRISRRRLGLRVAPAVIAAVALLPGLLAHGAESEVLFPEPLQLVREVDDPFSGTTVGIEEYCSGNRIVTRRGQRVVIADYGRQEVTEINHAEGTFSITSFAEIARARPAVHRSAGASAPGEGHALGVRRSAAGRSVETFEYAREIPGGREVVTVGVDRQVTLSAAAVEALVGAAFPNEKSFAHEAMIRAAAGGPAPGRRVQTASVPTLALPAEQTVTIESGNERLTFRSTVVRVERRLVPDEVLLIPPGARRIESKLIAAPRMLQELDSLPPPHR